MKLGFSVERPPQLIDALNRIAAAVEANTAVLGHLIEYRAAATPRAETLPPAGDGASPVPETHVAPSAPAGGSGQPEPRQRRKWSRWLTAERKEVLRRVWPTHMLLDEVRAELEKVGGPPLPDNHGIGNGAANMKLRRPADYMGRSPVSAPAAPPPVAPPPVAPLPVLEPVVLPVAAPPPPPAVAAPRPVAPVAAARPSAPPRAASPVASNEPVKATFKTIVNWAGVRGIMFDRPADLPIVNAKRQALGLAPFEIVRD